MDLPVDLPADLADYLALSEFAGSIYADLLRVHAKKLEGADFELCLRETYDAYAKAFIDAHEILTDTILRETIPRWVFHWVSIRQWYGYKLDEYATLRESSKWDFVNKLESRIAYWQAESLSPSKRPESPLPGPSLSTKSHIVEQFRRHIEHQGELEHERRLRAIREGKEAPSEPQREESIAGQINRLRRECNWTEEQLAEKVGVTTRTVQRHLAEDSMPYARHIATYERVFSKQLEREVVIRKMS